MKAQIKALDQAGKNAQDGASLIKTAEGYMGEIHDMLNRIVELAEKSANGTYETNKADGTEQTAAQEKYGSAGVDRQAIQDEVDQLTTEINRIAKTANFNGLKLMDGSMEEGRAATTKTTYPDSAYTAKAGVTAGTAGSDVSSYWLKDGDNYVKQSANATAAKTGAYYEVTAETVTVGSETTVGNNWYVSDGNGGYTKAEAGSTIPDTNTPTYYTLDPGTEKTVDRPTDGTDVTGLYELKDGKYVATEDTVAQKDGDNVKTYFELDDTKGVTTESPAGKSLKLQIGETSGAADKLEVSIKSFKTDDLFKDLDASVITENKSAAATTAEFEGTLTINVSNQDAASKAAEEVRKVINEVSSRRATLGAMENRLDYTMNNLDTASQNITDANSRIRDTDMAKTMMEYTQGNTLTQAAQAMLAQANQAPSQVLQLLQ
jgi:flagellin